MKHPKDSEDCCTLEFLPVAFPPDLGEKARLFRALGDEVRLRLLHLVRDQEVCVCDLVTVMAMPQGTVSHHLGVLHQAGLVLARKQGRWNYYRSTQLAIDAIAALRVPVLV